jgi:transcriptional regulator with XRE-family HTH domain
MITERLQEIVDSYFDGNKAKFAKSIGIAPTSISNYLGKQRASKPSIDMLEKIVNTLDVSPDWLLTGKGGMKKSNCENDDPLKEDLIRLRAENNVLRELVGLKKKKGLEDVG